MELLDIAFSYDDVSVNFPGRICGVGRLTMGEEVIVIIIKKAKTCKFLQILI
jgi:hypothetical protein